MCKKYPQSAKNPNLPKNPQSVKKSAQNFSNSTLKITLNPISQKPQPNLKITNPKICPNLISQP